MSLSMRFCGLENKRLTKIKLPSQLKWIAECGDDLHFMVCVASQNRKHAFNCHNFFSVCICLVLGDIKSIADKTRHVSTDLQKSKVK